MYDRCYIGRRGLKESFWVEEFVIKACQQESYMNERKTRCPCNKCHSTRIFPIETVKLHLYKNGFILTTLLGLIMENKSQMLMTIVWVLQIVV